MAKKEKKVPQKFGEVLKTFDLKVFQSWKKKYDPVGWEYLRTLTPETQMLIMCKLICSRTDMLATDAHRKAILWLKEHKMNDGRLF